MSAIQSPCAFQHGNATFSASLSCFRALSFAQQPRAFFLWVKTLLNWRNFIFEDLLQFRIRQLQLLLNSDNRGVANQPKYLYLFLYLSEKHFIGFLLRHGSFQNPPIYAIRDGCHCDADIVPQGTFCSSSESACALLPAETYRFLASIIASMKRRELTVYPHTLRSFLYQSTLVADH